MAPLRILPAAQADGELQDRVGAVCRRSCGDVNPFEGWSLSHGGSVPPPGGTYAFADGDVVAALRDGELVGVCVFRLPEWDRDLFGHVVGRVDVLWAADPAVSSELVAWADNAAVTSGARFVGARVPADDLVAAHALEAAGFRFMEVLRHPWYRLADWSDGSPGCSRPALPCDVDAMATIAGSAFAADRFHRDACIPVATADALYEKWTRGWFESGATTRGATVLEIDGVVRAFALHEIDRRAAEGGPGVARLRLTAVDRACRGRGLATALLRGALPLLSVSAAYAVGAYSLGNAPMDSLHRRLGARYGSVGEISFHKWYERQEPET